MASEWRRVIPREGSGSTMPTPAPGRHLSRDGADAQKRPAPALYVVAAAELLLLFIGLHKAWDAAVWIAARRR